MSAVMRLLARGVADLRLRPLAAFLTVCAVAMAAFLCGLFVMFLHNLDAEMAKRHGVARFQVYWSQGADVSDIRRQWDELAGLPGLAALSTFTPDQALAALTQTLNGTVDFSFLRGKSPLPYTALVAVQAGGDFAAASKRTYEYLKALPGVERVSFNPVELDAGGSLAVIGRSLFWPLATFCIAIAALVVGYTVRLAMLGSQGEIDVLRLVGARDWYIRLPLASSGAVMGLAGTVLALALLKAAQLYLADVLYYPPLWIRIGFLSVGQCAALILAVTLVSLVASWLAARD